MEYGYIGISRKLFKNWIYPLNQSRKFTEFEAWIEIIRLAYFVCTEKYIQGKVLMIPRGSFDTTVLQLSTIFQWDRRTTEKFLKLLEDQGMITRSKISNSSKACSILSITNYNDYQADVCDICESKLKGTCNMQYCKKKESPEDEVKKFKKPTLQEVQAYCSERNNGIDAETFIDFYESKGWKVGKDTMKDWKASVRTWERKNKKPETKKQKEYVPDQEKIDFYMRLSK